jgi:hypothetical protein
MIQVSRGMKDIKERRGEERRGEERALPGACQLTWSDPERERELEGLEGASSVCLDRVPRREQTVLLASIVSERERSDIAGKSLAVILELSRRG